MEPSAYDLELPDAAVIDAAAVPAAVDRATWQAQLDGLLVREKAHTREGDAIAAARRRLPMVEVDGATPLVGAEGRVTLLETFEGRRQLLVYYHMWHDGRACRGAVRGVHLLQRPGARALLPALARRHLRHLLPGAYEESVASRDFMGWDVPWYSAQGSADQLLAGRWFGMQVCYLRDGARVFETYWSSGRAAEALAPSYAMLDMTAYGRQEIWEESPDGWPQRFATSGEQFRTNGRPTAQWSRLERPRR